MATVQQEFDIGASLLGLYGDLPYVKKLGYSVGELGERILLRVIIDYTNDDEFFDNSMDAVRTARKFRDMMPDGMRDRYEVVPIVTDPYEGALWHWHDGGSDRPVGEEAAADGRHGRGMAPAAVGLQQEGARKARGWRHWQVLGLGDRRDALRHRDRCGRVCRGGGHAAAQKPRGRRAAVERRLLLLLGLYDDHCAPGLEARYYKGYAMAESAWRRAARCREALA